MITKFKKSIKEYRYILGFDLAKNVSGWTVMDTVTNSVVDHGIINSSSMDDDCIWEDFLKEISSIIKKQTESFGNRGGVLITKEKLPTQAGRFSTISTLQALAEVHAIFNLACKMSKEDVYDYDGVHSVSVKAFFSKLVGDKPTKEQIRERLSIELNQDDILKLSLDESDSLAVSYVLLNKKYNQDLDDAIKQLKKDQKKYKSDKKISEIDNKITILQNLKI